MQSRYLLCAAVALVLPGCGSPDHDAPPESRSVVQSPDGRDRIVFLGTSLTAGLGLDPDEAYPARIQERLKREGLDYEVVNAGQSGETSAGARARVDWVLREPAAVLVIETGANDGLRGVDVDSLRANIQAIIDAARDRPDPPRIVLVGMEAPPNLGPRYTGRFRTVYQDLARRNGVAFVPFLLTGVAGVDSLNQPDGIHPTPRGQEIVADNVWAVLGPMLTSGEK